jgi:hypothetical protein
MKVLTFKKPLKMIDALENHAKINKFKKFIICDDYRNLKFGFVDARRNVYFFIHLNDLRTSDLLLRKRISQTIAGTIKNRIAYCQKLNKLK